MALRANRKLSCLGTKLRMASVTRQPLRLRTHLGSRLRRRETSRRLRLSGIDARARRANSRSIFGGSEGGGDGERDGGRDGRWKEWREGGMEGGMEGGREDGWREGGMDGGRDGWREGGMDGEREEGRER